MADDNITYTLGVLADLSTLSPYIEKETLEHYIKDNEAIGRLAVRGVITGSERGKAYERLSKKINKSIQE